MNLLTAFDRNRNNGLKVLFIANDAPLSSKGGQVAEHYNTGYHQDIFEKLQRMNLDVWSTRDEKELLNPEREFNYVFTLLNRLNFQNSEVFVASLCEYYGVAYLGAKPNIRALAEDKHLTKILAKNLKIPTSEWSLYRFGDGKVEKPDFSGPYFVKWRFGASSVDISEENCAIDWEAALKRISIFHAQKKDVIIERLLLGDCITVPVLLADRPWALPAVVSKSEKKFGLITFEQARKLEGGLHRELLNDHNLYRRLREYALKLFDAVRPVDYLRADFRIDHLSGMPQLLEFNICCNISSESAIAMAANSIDISHEQLISHILNQSLLRQRFSR